MHMQFWRGMAPSSRSATAPTASTATEGISASSMVLTESFIRLLRHTFRLDWEGLHGAPHWSRVRDNGLRLARGTGANVQVVEYFAFLHDVCRRNDGRDPEHGLRAAKFAGAIRADHIALGNLEFELLVTALEGHTGGTNPGDITVATCWDSDRLDLGRLGIRPVPERLCTEVAQRSEVIDQAWDRSRAWLERHALKRADHL